MLLIAAMSWLVEAAEPELHRQRTLRESELIAMKKTRMRLGVVV